MKNECTLFAGGRQSAGYGVVWIDCKPMLAHRKVMADLHGEAAIEGKLILHHCDMPACVNPDHLYIGTKSDNARDYVRRHRPPKVSIDDAREIRRLYAEREGMLQRELGERFGVSQEYISSIIRGKVWPE